MEDFQKEQKVGKQKKFQRDRLEFETGNILDLERKRGRSRSHNRSSKQNDRTDSQEVKKVTFLEKPDKIDVDTLGGIHTEKRN